MKEYEGEQKETLSVFSRYMNEIDEGFRKIGGRNKCYSDGE